MSSKKAFYILNFSALVNVAKKKDSSFIENGSSNTHIWFSKPRENKINVSITRRICNLYLQRGFHIYEFIFDQYKHTELIFELGYCVLHRSMWWKEINELVQSKWCSNIKEFGKCKLTVLIFSLRCNPLFLCHDRAWPRLCSKLLLSLRRKNRLRKVIMMIE